MVAEPEVELELEHPENGEQLLEKPFNPAFINIKTKTPSLDTLITRMSEDPSEIELNTASYFQRNPNLWEPVKQSRLIESILIRFPLPAFYFDGSDDKKWLVVDGLQRLSSIRNFVIGKSLQLTGLEFLTQLNGKYYDELDRDLKRLIHETQVVVYIINPGTPADVKFNIFKRINTGGLILEPQEIRHALFQGVPSQFIAELAEIEEFKAATTWSIKTRRMLDRDFANRFLAFYLFGFEAYQPDLDTFMSRAMANTANMSKVDLEKIKTDFASSMQLNREIFGENAFRKWPRENERRKPLNKALFDVFSVCFARLADRQRAVLIAQKDEFTEQFKNLLYNDDENQFFWAVSSATGDRRRVYYRFSRVQSLINQFAG